MKFKTTTQCGKLTDTWHHRQSPLRLFGAGVASFFMLGGVLMPVTGHLPVAHLSVNPFPTDVENRCPAGTSKLSFDNWFSSHHPTAGGMVEAADGTTVDYNGTLDFYRWAYQMFLHVTSPAKGPGSQPIFMSPEFYALSTPDPKTGERKLIDQTLEETPTMATRINKSATDNYSIIRDTAGSRYIVVPMKKAATGNVIVSDSKGQMVEASYYSIGSSGKIEFVDTSGKIIVGSLPTIEPSASQEISARKLVGSKLISKVGLRVADPTVASIPPTPVLKVLSGDKFVFTNLNGDVIPTIPTESGQADGNVQLTRPYKVDGKLTRSLVYYNLAVNDAYAYLRTMVSHGLTTPDISGYDGDVTPTYPEEIASVVDYAKKHGKTVAHPNALIMELKTAWVDAAAVSNPQNYITVTAVVPTYDTSNPLHWIQTGTKKMNVALVGMHLVGSTQQVYAMVWATFEHQLNAPNYSYSYMNASGKEVKLKSAVGDGQDYLFNDLTSTGTSFKANAKVQAGKTSETIDAIKHGESDSISGCSISRLSPYGSPNDEAPNGFDKSPASSNSSIISLNLDVYNRLPDSDPRKYYFLAGATWTNDNMGPDLLWTQKANPWHFDGFHYPNILGTPFLANSTMETFEQAPSYQDGGVVSVPMSGWTGRIHGQGGTPWSEISQAPAVGCFSCHQGLDVTTMSHVFKSIKPLW